MSVSEESVTVTVDDTRSVTAIHTPPHGEHSLKAFVYAPGAGSNVHDPFGVYLCRRLAGNGVAVWRFQFPYMEQRRRLPDPPAVLERTWRSVIGHVADDNRRLVIGGRSMGGRIASQVLAIEKCADALALFAYPLHPPGKPEQLRDAHLSSIGVPTLFCSGTNDAFASAEELALVASKMKRAAAHLMANADHGFNAPKSSGRTRQAVWVEAADVLLAWLVEIRI